MFRVQAPSMEVCSCMTDFCSPLDHSAHTDISCTTCRLMQHTHLPISTMQSVGISLKMCEFVSRGPSRRESARIVGGITPEVDVLGWCSVQRAACNDDPCVDPELIQTIALACYALHVCLDGDSHSQSTLEAPQKKRGKGQLLGRRATGLLPTIYGGPLQKSRRPPVLPRLSRSWSPAGSCRFQ